ncbi:unnamed protein product [Dracunculus medinensis]|uniref:Uncharacterized protein n=1 Tax=Dracunculus medinensis TaxID=318479 RepID=A0A0N4UDI7_DRAME|nr:unnamed protein product [Dracunculus medinensis]
MNFAGECRISEKLVVLRRGNVHEVPICNPIIKYPNGVRIEEELDGKPVQYNKFKCMKPFCRICRCDIARGFKLASKNSSKAECVLKCPITKSLSRRCFKFGTATVCYD